MEHWNNLWSNSLALSSFAESEMALGYKGVIADFWLSVFENQADKSVIADLCCGNGALLLAAATYASTTKKNYVIYGIDAAKINFSNVQQQLAKLKPQVKVKFFEKMSVEKMPFENQSLDLAISQFGFEYTDLDASLTEIHRVLKQGASFYFIAHHPDSFISKDCKLGFDILRLLLVDYVYFDLAISLIDLTLQLQQKGLSPQNVPAFEQVNIALLNIMQEFNHRYPSDEAKEWYTEIFRQTANAVLKSDAKALESIIKLKTNTQYHLQRLQQQQTVALTPQLLDSKLALKPMLFTSAFYKEIYTDEGLVGIAVKLIRI